MKNSWCYVCTCLLLAAVFNANEAMAQQRHYPMTISAIGLGEAALVFHGGELYGYYGLAIRRDSPFPYTLVVGYADDLVGYLCDPRAYEREEYGAVAVPKVIDLPPFTRTAAREFAQAATQLLRKLTK